MKYDYKKIGEQLKERRLELGMEIDEIIDQIKISETYLIAIEEGQIENLPSEIYYGLFVRSYARELGIDAELLLEGATRRDQPREENGEINTQQSDKTQKPDAPSGTKADYKEPEAAQKARGGNLGLWITILVLAAFIIVLVVVLSYDKESEAPTEGVAAIEETIQESDTLPQPAVQQEETDTDQEETPAQNESQRAAATPPPEESPGPERPPLRMNLDVLDSCWIVITSDGDTVLHRVLDSGETRQLRADQYFNISIGNSYSCEIEINDTLLRRLSPGSGVVTDLEINRNNYRNYFKLPEDTTGEGT